MKLKIKKLKDGAQLPKYAKEGDVGLDMYSMETVTIKPGEHYRLWHGFALEFPTGYAAIVKDKKLSGVYRKMILPNYGVFDEKRYFKPGKKPYIFTLNSIKAGIEICEDLWQDDSPIREQAKKGAVVPQ